MPPELSSNHLRISKNVLQVCKRCRKRKDNETGQEWESRKKSHENAICKVNNKRWLRFPVAADRLGRSKKINWRRIMSCNHQALCDALKYFLFLIHFIFSETGFLRLEWHSAVIPSRSFLSAIKSRLAAAQRQLETLKYRLKCCRKASFNLIPFPFLHWL